MRKLIETVIRDTQRGVSTAEAAKKYGVDPGMTEQIARLYVTHPGVTVDGIMTKMGLWGRNFLRFICMIEEFDAAIESPQLDIDIYRDIYYCRREGCCNDNCPYIYDRTQPGDPLADGIQAA
jgi:hypothetical protein